MASRFICFPGLLSAIAPMEPHGRGSGTKPPHPKQRFGKLIEIGFASSYCRFDPVLPPLLCAEACHSSRVARRQAQGQDGGRDDCGAQVQRAQVHAPQMIPIRGSPRNLNSGNYCALKVSLHPECNSGAHRPERPVLTLVDGVADTPDGVQFAQQGMLYLHYHTGQLLFALPRCVQFVQGVA